MAITLRTPPLQFGRLSGWFFVLAGVLVQTQIAWAQIGCVGHLTPTETVICATPELMQLDRMLGAAYQAALRLAPDPKVMRSEQRNWIARRNQCDRYDCLKPQYRSRIAELQSAQVKTLGMLEKPLTRQDAMRICADLAHRVDGRSIDELGLLTRWTTPAGLGVSELTDEEEARLGNMKKWPAYHGRALVYELKLRHDAPPTRFASFWGRRDCRSARMFNLDRYLASNGSDDGRVPNSAQDAETEWALSTAEDRLILHDGRYLMFTGSPGGSESIVSWVRPDGILHPVCTLRTRTKSMALRKSGDRTVCEARGKGQLPRAEWRREEPDPSDCCPRALSNPYDGDDPIAAFSAQIGLDAKQKQHLLVRLAYGSGNECGSIRTWSTVLYEDLRQVAKTQLLELLQPVYFGKATWPEIYRLQHRHFVEVGKADGTYELMEIDRGRLRQVCEFERRTATSVEPFSEFATGDRRQPGNK
jgi:uncharacterized protein